MKKKITIPNNSKVVIFFDYLNKKKEETRNKIAELLIKKGILPKKNN